jgi:hypothetical protein
MGGFACAVFNSAVHASWQRLLRLFFQKKEPTLPVLGMLAFFNVCASKESHVAQNLYKCQNLFRSLLLEFAQALLEIFEGFQRFATP